MAAGLLSRPGTKHGPCRSRCKHVDCNCSRHDAAAVCRFCKKPIGYGTRFYREARGLVHAVCLEDAKRSVADATDGEAQA